MISYPARYKRSGDYWYIEFVDISNTFTHGENMEELLENAQDVLSATLSVMLEENLPLPEPSSQEGENIVYIRPFYDVMIPVILKKFREENKITQKEIARKMGVEYQQYQKIERGKKSNITIKTLERLVKALGKKLVLDIV